MILGEAGAWASSFISADERILERIAAIWPGCLQLLPGQPEEDIITLNLVHVLENDPVIRSMTHWVAYQHHPSGTDANGQKFSKGKIDIAFFLDRDRERYIAYECKRLNVMYDGRRNSLASGYVADGMMRFITEQYAEGLPIGCMLGYVLDGDTPFAIAQIESAIASHTPLNLVKGPTGTAALQNVQRFITRHTRSGSRTIELRHAFLPFPPTGRPPRAPPKRKSSSRPLHKRKHAA